MNVIKIPHDCTFEHRYQIADAPRANLLAKKRTVNIIVIFCKIFYGQFFKKDVNTFFDLKKAIDKHALSFQ